MINGDKIGVGIVTTGSRVEQFKRAFGFFAVVPDEVEELVVVIDGPDVNNLKEWCIDTIKGVDRLNVIINDENIGVGRSKNKLLRHLLKYKCDHIFLVEDDIYVKKSSVLRKYIETSRITGIQHLNFSQHGMMNKSWPVGIPNPSVCVEYKELELPLYPHCVGAFSYYTRKCLETVGLIDEKYYNACEHVDHTLLIIKAGMHPPFWYFADIEKSWEYLGDYEWSRENSTISSNPNHNQMMIDADKIFKEKHGHLPGWTVLYDRQEVTKTLREIQNKYGI